jgi:hypothetical protein
MGSQTYYGLGSRTRCFCYVVPHTECSCCTHGVFALALKRAVLVSMHGNVVAWRAPCSATGTGCNVGGSLDAAAAAKNSASALGVNYGRKLAAFGGWPGPCWRSLREHSRSWLALVRLLGLLVLQCRPVFTFSPMSDNVECIDCLALQVPIFNTLPFSQVSSNRDWRCYAPR